MQVSTFNNHPDPYSLIGDIGLNYTHIGLNQFIEKHRISYSLTG